MLRMSDWNWPNCVWLAVPQPTEWQRIGNQIDSRQKALTETAQLSQDDGPFEIV